MPELVDIKGKPVEVAPLEADAVNRRFDAAMNDDGPADEQAPPKRQARSAADEPPKRRGRPPKAEQSRVTPKAPVQLDDAQRAQGAKGLAQIGAGVALMVGKATGKEAFQADAVTIASHADQLADAAVQIAKTDPAFAARLDKVCAAGPYSALIVVLISMASQGARNHKPELSIPGTVHPKELLAAAGPEIAEAA